MSENQPTEITLLLGAAVQGDEQSRDKLWSAVYQELRGMAGGMMAREQAGHTLQPTALVHEAYIRLLGGQKLARANRPYFFRAAAQAMRRILIEHARKLSFKKERDAGTLSFLQGLTGGSFESSADGLNALERALDDLAKDDTRVHDVVMLRFFAGLTVEETADALEVSPRTVKRNWTWGRAWLYRRIAEGVTASDPV